MRVRGIRAYILAGLAVGLLALGSALVVDAVQLQRAAAVVEQAAGPAWRKLVSSEVPLPGPFPGSVSIKILGIRAVRWDSFLHKRAGWRRWPGRPLPAIYRCGLRLPREPGRSPIPR